MRLLFTVTGRSQWDEILRLVGDSEKLLKATWEGSETEMADRIEKA